MNGAVVAGSQGRHLALIVEDEPLAAEEVAETVAALGHEPLHVDNREQAIEALRKHEVCYVLLDRQIKGRPDSVQPRVEAGDSLLEEIRRVFPGRWRGGNHALPVLVMSGNAKERHDIRRTFTNGGDDFIFKPFSENGLPFPDQIAEALKKSGRERHECCAAAHREARAANDAVSIAISGRESGKRTEILVAGRSVLLTGASFVLFLLLVRARLVGDGWAHKNDLGGGEERGWKQLSRLKAELGAILPGALPAFENDRNGLYRLSPQIAIGEIDWPQLASHSAAPVRAFARDCRPPR